MFVGFPNHFTAEAAEPAEKIRGILRVLNGLNGEGNGASQMRVKRGMVLVLQSMAKTIVKGGSND